ncbi:MAG: tRNA (N6-threonylcarbamoyladenosine(37)-N6)-methyltransferase TrmO [Prevotella sp.]|nr:tRNA (N6-threonylcarbamoyladenosine(37)-N6)-methyltransferase TrmO [Prevotella sp.]
MEIRPIAYFNSPFTSKFGIPRQSGLVDKLRGTIVFTDEYSSLDAVRGLDGFDCLWIIWGFSENVSARKHPTVRPPRLGGNRQMGVFATRSPFRPNNLGLSAVRINKIEMRGGKLTISVSGADLMHGTPIYDIKPYVVQADCRPGIRSGFTDTEEWKTLSVSMPEEYEKMFDGDELDAVKQALALDPRPHYHSDAERIYGMPFAGRDVRFTVEDSTVRVVDVVDARE